MNNLDIAREIIKEQSLIIGERLAKNRAEASGIVGFNSDNISDLYLISDDPSVIKKVIISYADVFGVASTQVCYEVLKRIQTRVRTTS